MNKTLPFFYLLLTFSVTLVLSAETNAAPWPTLYRDVQRSGFTEEFVEGPYERKWRRDYHEEMIASRVGVIVAEEQAFVGTFAGRMHALNVADGSTAWTFEAEGAIGDAPFYEDGHLYFGADDGFLYCVRAEDGELLWRYRAEAGIWVSPVSDGETVYFGDRGGVFHAVATDSGKPRWTYRTGGMILTSASLSEDREKIVFGSEEMRVFCLSPEGSLLWKSEKLGGLSLRDQAPTIWKGLAIVRTNPAHSFHHAAGQNPDVMTRAQKALEMKEEDAVIFDQWGTYSMRLTSRRLEAERRAILDYLDENPGEKTFYAFDLETGEEPWTAPVLYTGGLHNPGTPPTFNPETGELYLWVPTALSNYSAGVPGGAIAAGRLDRETGHVEILWHDNGDTLGWAFHFAAPADETQSLSLMGNVLLNTHQGIVGGLNLDTLKWHTIHIARDTYAGMFGPAIVPGSFASKNQYHREGYLVLMANEWHGPARSIVSIGEDRLFWVAGSQVVCLGGPSVPGGEESGTSPPPLSRRAAPPVVPAGNVAAGGVGGYDESIERVRIHADALRPFLQEISWEESIEDAPQTEAFRQKLDDAVSELLEGYPWSPFIVQLGISGEERHFDRTADTMRALALAIPHLSHEVRDLAKDTLHRLFTDGHPLAQPGYPGREGAPREFFDPGRQMIQHASSTPGYELAAGDLYAVWAYAHFADAWDFVLGEKVTIMGAFERFAAEPFAFDHDDESEDAAEHLNSWIAGALGYARIMDRAGEAEERERALELLAQRVTERVHHERADTNFVRHTRSARYNLHQGKIPRYLELTPELGALLREYAGEELERNVRALSRELPVWHHAFGERLIGGENYISPPHLSRALFAAFAHGVGASAEELHSRLDQPWSRADLYYIEKLTAILMGGIPGGPAEIGLSPSRERTGQYERIDFEIDAPTDYFNPFDSGEVSLVLEITDPHGVELTVPAFFYQPFERRSFQEGERTRTWLYPQEAPRWQARFAPAETGRYEVRAALTDAGGTRYSQGVSFQSVPSARAGFLHVSEDDSRFFATSDGEPFFPIGQNMAFIGEGQYLNLIRAEEMLRRLGEHGANYVRVWAGCHDWAMGVEARKSAFGRSWDWQPPFAPHPDNPDREAVRLSGEAGDALQVNPSQRVALRPQTHYRFSGRARTEEGAAFDADIGGRGLPEALRSTDNEWVSWAIEFTTGTNEHWLGAATLRLAEPGAAWVDSLSLVEAEGGQELLWEADPNRPARGVYNQPDSFVLDKVLTAAEESNIRIQLTLFTRDLYMDDLVDESSTAYQRAIDDGKNLLRYAVGRWGYSTSVAVWEYFNEMNPGRPTTRFYRELGEYLDEIDPYGHMRSTSTWSASPRDWELDALDFADEHFYLRPDDYSRLRDEVDAVADKVALLREHAPDKPVLLGEFGLADEQWRPTKEMLQTSEGVDFHNILWASALSGASGTALYWWWDLLDPRNPYPHYQSLAAFLEGIQWTTAGLQPARARVVDGSLPDEASGNADGDDVVVVGLSGDDGTFLWLFNPRAAWHEVVVAENTPDSINGRSLVVEGLDDATYDVRWWDTREGRIIAESRRQKEGRPLRISIPEFDRDIACRIMVRESRGVE